MQTDTIQPNFKFLISNPSHFIALGFGSGLAPKAPGTFGTLMALPLFFLLPTHQWLWSVMLILLFGGIYICDITGKNLGVSDHGSIVWDEIFAMLLILKLIPYTIIMWVIAFLLFRFFDIWKPYPIRQVDAQVKGGLGVMLDDVLAAIYTLITIYSLNYLYSFSTPHLLPAVNHLIH